MTDNLLRLLLFRNVDVNLTLLKFRHVGSLLVDRWQHLVSVWPRPTLTLRSGARHGRRAGIGQFHGVHRLCGEVGVFTVVNRSVWRAGEFPGGGHGEAGIWFVVRRGVLVRLWGLVVDRGGLGAVHVLRDRHNVQTHLVVYRLRRRLWISVQWGSVSYLVMCYLKAYM